MHLQSEASRPRWRGGGGGGEACSSHEMMLEAYKTNGSKSDPSALFSTKQSRRQSLCRSRKKLRSRVTPTAPWETRTVLAGRGRGSPCWSRWARWSDAADRGSEAGRWREGRRPERAEARGRVPCYRLAGSSWFQRDSAPLDAFQSPARSRANTHTHDSGLSLGMLGFFLVKTVDSASNDAPGRAAGGYRCFCSVDWRLYRPTLDPSVG